MTSATDNRATELRRLLDERGIEYATDDHMGLCETSWNGFTAIQLTPTAKLTMVLTPEQAIAATLGSGAFTIKQIKSAVLKNFHYDHLTPPQFDWQAIADELNELGSETCENIAPDYLDFLCSKCGFVHYHSDENDTGDGNDWNYCPNCGKRVSA